MGLEQDFLFALEGCQRLRLLDAARLGSREAPWRHWKMPWCRCDDDTATRNKKLLVTRALLPGTIGMKLPGTRTLQTDVTSPPGTSFVAMHGRY